MFSNIPVSVCVYFKELFDNFWSQLIQIVKQTNKTTNCEKCRHKSKFACEKPTLNIMHTGKKMIVKFCQFVGLLFISHKWRKQLTELIFICDMHSTLCVLKTLQPFISDHKKYVILCWFIFEARERYESSISLDINWLVVTIVTVLCFTRELSKIYLSHQISFSMKWNHLTFIDNSFDFCF